MADRPTDQKIIEMIDMALSACWSQYEAVQQLAMHYPEAHRVLSSPRKPDAIIILERLRHVLAAADSSEADR